MGVGVFVEVEYRSSGQIFVARKDLVEGRDLIMVLPQYSGSVVCCGRFSWLKLVSELVK